jgi:hypothetical protein
VAANLGAEAYDLKSNEKIPDTPTYADQLNRLKIRTRQGSRWRDECVARLLRRNKVEPEPAKWLSAVVLPGSTPVSATNHPLSCLPVPSKRKTNR